MGLDSNNAILNMMYRGTTTIADFNWDAMTTVPILYLMTPDDIDYIKNLILSPRYSGNNKYKMEKIDEIMHYRGFSRFAGGTNRLVYTHPMAPNAVFKVAIDSIGINDNPAEFRNQHFLKPYCCKVFECSPCGTIASFEKVDRITTFEEFYTIADDYYYIIVNVILGKYVMDDIGIDYFMNVGIRVGCYPVLLDFPYLFELDGRKLECSNVLDDGRICSGEIDYDAGFNKLVCKKCGRVYRARDLAKPPKEGGILLRQKGGRRMLLEITRGDKVIKTYDSTIERDYLSRNDRDVTNDRVPEVVLKRVSVKTNNIKASAPKAEQPVESKPTKNESNTPEVVTRVKEIDISGFNRVEDVTPATSTNEDHIVEVVLNRPTKSVSEPIEEPKQDRDTDTKVVVHNTEIGFPDGTIIQPAMRPVSDSDIGIVAVETDDNHIVEIKFGKDVDDSEEITTTNDDKPMVSESIDNEISEEHEIVEDIDHNSIIPSVMINTDLNPSKMIQAVYFGDEPGGYDPEENKEKEDDTMENPNVDVPVNQPVFIDMIDVVDGDIDYDLTVIMNYLNEREIEPKVGYIVMVHHTYTNRDDDDFFAYVYSKFDNDDDPRWENIEYTDVDYDILKYLKEYEKASETYVNSKEEEHSEIDDTEEQYPEVEPDMAEDLVEVDDDPVEEEIDEVAESTTDNEIDVSNKKRIVITSKIPTVDDADEVTFYCVPRHSKVNTDDLGDGIDNANDINIDKYRIYVREGDDIISVRCFGGRWYDFDEDAVVPIEFLVGNNITFISGSDLPDFEDAETGTYYLLSTDKEDVYDAFIKKIGSDEYSFYLRVTTVPAYTEEESNTEEENIDYTSKMFEALKASSKKKSIEDIMK